MKSRLDQITLQGFKSIKDLSGLHLGRINVLIGANGSGKSNFVDFFRMLRAMADGALSQYFLKGGGVDTFFYGGPRVTKEFSASLMFGQNGFRFAVEPTASSDAIVTKQSTYYGGASTPTWTDYGAGGKEGSLSGWKGDTSSLYGRGYLSVRGHIHEAIAGWIVYHFHDTSPTAPMRRDQSVHDFRELRPDASNIAAFLMKMQQDQPSKYRRITETVKLIAPFFDDFMLEPEKKGENELVRLQWRQKRSSFPFQPFQLSDGTMRFICLVTALLQPAPPSTIVIDEPELGLHPFALEALAALLHETSLRTQLILSTQSASLLDHFDSSDIIVVERHEQASRFRRLDPQSLENWVQDYTLGELVSKNIVESGPTYE